MSNPFLRMRSSQQAARDVLARETVRETIARLSHSIPEAALWRDLPRFRIGETDYFANRWLDTRTESGILEYGDYIIPIVRTKKDGVWVEKPGGKHWLLDDSSELLALELLSQGGARPEGGDDEVDDRGGRGEYSG